MIADLAERTGVVQAGAVISPAADLAALEEVIERGQKVYIAVGMALMTIRDRRLYLAAYPTFEAYNEDRWDLERTRVRVDQRGDDDHRTVEIPTSRRSTKPRPSSSRAGARGGC